MRFVNLHLFEFQNSTVYFVYEYECEYKNEWLTALASSSRLQGWFSKRAFFFNVTPCPFHHEILVLYRLEEYVGGGSIMLPALYKLSSLRF